jgi:hypothetical protein
MTFPWSAKSDHAEPSSASSDAVSTGDVREILERLGQLGETYLEVNHALAAYLIEQQSHPAAVPQSPMPSQGSEPAGALCERMDALGGKIDGLCRQGAAVSETVRQLQDQLDRSFQQMAELLQQRESNPAPAMPVASSVPVSPPHGQQAAGGTPRIEAAPAANTDWERAIFGPGLAARPELAGMRQQFLTDVLGNNSGACALAGQLFLFHSSPVERLPQLLKEIGEAYYRWQPKSQPGTNPVEEALAAWLQKACEDAGIHNTIELVHPGERFDAARHNAASRGVEISEVHGWIVLRDNGKVYTKASVAVR